MSYIIFLFILIFSFVLSCNYFLFFFNSELHSFFILFIAFISYSCNLFLHFKLHEFFHSFNLFLHSELQPIAHPNMCMKQSGIESFTRSTDRTLMTQEQRTDFRALTNDKCLTATAESTLTLVLLGWSHMLNELFPQVNLWTSPPYHHNHHHHHHYVRQFHVYIRQLLLKKRGFISYYIHTHKHSSFKCTERVVWPPKPPEM